MDTVTVVSCTILIYLILKANTTLAQCSPRRKEFALEFANKAITSTILGALTTNGEIVCQYSCHSHDNCDAYNFNLDDNRCEILDARSAFFNVVDRKGWVFRAQKCELDKCKNGGSCFHAIGKARCLCPCGFKGEFCEVTATNHDNVLLFPGDSIQDMVIREYPFSTGLSELTVSMWVQVDRTTEEERCPFSFLTKNSVLDDVVVVMLHPTSTKISINNNWNTLRGQAITDSDWHHLLFTWESITGKLAFYIDGIKKGGLTGVAVRTTIGKGALVLGQEQDEYLGGYDAKQAFKGNLTSLNMWDKVLTASEISDLARKCPTEEGNIVQWSQLINLPRLGNVKLICKTFCIPN